MWEHFHHQADIGIRGTGSTLERAFEEAAVALTAVICSPGKVRPEQEIEIAAKGDDPELLFFDWISAIIYEMDVRKMLFSRFAVHLEDGRLKASAWGEPADPDRHELAVEVKAATFMQLKVIHDADGQMTAQCVVDV